MDVKFYEDINEFYNLAFPFLIKHEAENNLPLAILNSLKKDFDAYRKEQPLLVSVSDGGDLKLIVLRTPPYDLLISYTDNLETIDYIVEAFLMRELEFPGLLSFHKAADRFAKLWSEKKSVKSDLFRRERVYKLTSINEETIGYRNFRKASKTDLPIVLKWAEEMMIEALVDVDEAQINDMMNQIKNEFEEEKIRFYILFNEEESVSIVRKAGKTPNGNFINFVYTPPSLRRRGYATECVAKISKLLLEEGNKYCFLFTDLSNPTSNSIYQKVGYRPVIDENHYKFKIK